jgi:MFS transporter, PAT family, solute carrier family 33 (acetyl-CoA transportor), member 1
MKSKLLKNDQQTSPIVSQRLKEDYGNILFLLFIYFLQGLPIGLSTSIPYILSSRNVSYSNQGTFSLSHWPYALKLIWAPIVDSVFSKRLGRRKSWIIPSQYMIGIFMFAFAGYVDQLLNDSTSILQKDNTTIVTTQDVHILTLIFFLFQFLAATQDIAIDGWGLTILLKENFIWASICNNIGTQLGALIGNSLVLVFESARFCNEHIRPLFGLEPQLYGMISIKSIDINFYTSIILN